MVLNKKKKQENLVDFEKLENFVTRQNFPQLVRHGVVPLKFVQNEKLDGVAEETQIPWNKNHDLGEEN